jgi:hypothetical protein
MNSEKVNVLDIVLFIILIALFGVPALMTLLAGEVLGSLFLGGITLICGWLMVEDLRKGVRAPTRYEWFKAWMTVRPVVVCVVGIGAILAIVSPPMNPLEREAAVPLLLLVVLIWVAALIFTLWRAPHRRESDAGYKRRVGYKE